MQPAHWLPTALRGRTLLRPSHWVCTIHRKCQDRFANVWTVSNVPTAFEYALQILIEDYPTLGYQHVVVVIASKLLGYMLTALSYVVWCSNVQQ
jgi:hypothetical protein